MLVCVNSSICCAVNVLSHISGTSLLGKERYVVVDFDIVRRLKDSINKYSLCYWDNVAVIHELLS